MPEFKLNLAGGASEAKQVEILNRLTLLANNSTGAGKDLTLKQLIELIEANQAWMQAHMATQSWFESHNLHVDGTVSLDQEALDAIASISNGTSGGSISGPIDLSAATLSALENIVVTGQVSLDAATLTALESITAVVSGTVNIGNLPSTYPLPSNQVQTNALTNSELRSAPVVVDTGLTIPQPQVDALTEAQLRSQPLDVDIRTLSLALDAVRQTLVPSTPLSVSITGPVTNSVIVDVPADKRIRVIRNAGHVDPQLSSEVFPLVTIKIGSLTIYRDKLETGLPWSETVCFEGGLGEDLTISLDAGTVYLNCRYELF